MNKVFINVVVALALAACGDTITNVNLPDSDKNTDAAQSSSGGPPITGTGFGQEDGSASNEDGGSVAVDSGNPPADGSVSGCGGEGWVRCWNNERQVCTGSVWTNEQSTGVPCNNQCTAALGAYKVVVSGAFNNVVERNGISYERRLRPEDTYANAKATCTGLGWRLPNVSELSILMNDAVGNCNPRADQAAMIIPADEESWTLASTPLVSTYAFSNGNVTQRTSTDKHKYLCVK